jgi:hypothetical protein
MTTETTNYRGADIERAPYGNGYMWSDHWTSSGCGSGNTIEECKEDIDEMFNELES